MPVTLLFLVACVVCIWLGYEWGRDMGTSSPEMNDAEDLSSFAKGPHIVWRCWKCSNVLMRQAGTFETPGQPPITPRPVSTLGVECASCKAYNVMKPAGMNARLQEEVL
jgi:hypothetical protein